MSGETRGEERQPRTSESADLVRMLHLLKRLQKGLGIAEPMDETAIRLMLEGAEATREELRRMGKRGEVRVCRYLIRYLDMRRDEIEEA